MVEVCLLARSHTLFSRGLGRWLTHVLIIACVNSSVCGTLLVDQLPVPAARHGGCKHISRKGRRDRGRMPQDLPVGVCLCGD